MNDAAIRRAIHWFLQAPALLPAGLALVHAGLVFWLSSLSGETFGARGAWFGFVSNLAHAPLFSVFGFLIAAALTRRAADSLDGLVLGWRRAALAVTIGLAYAGFDEWHQSLVPGRSPDPRDLMTDLAGILAGVLVVHATVQSHSIRVIARGVGVIVVLACASAWFASRG